MSAPHFDQATADFVGAADALTSLIKEAGAPDRESAAALAAGMLLLITYNRTGGMDSAEAAHYVVTSAESIYERETVQPLDEALRWLTEEGRTLLARHLVQGLSRAGGIAPLIGG